MNADFERAPPTYLIRDRDSIYGHEFRQKVRALGVREIHTPVRAPKANAIAERFVGTLRRECLDHVFIFNERHLQKIVDEFAVYYNRLEHDDDAEDEEGRRRLWSPPRGIT